MVRKKKPLIVHVTRTYPRTDKICQFCGKEFAGTAKAMYCRPLHAKYAYYERHKQERLAKQREAYRQKKAKKK